MPEIVQDIGAYAGLASILGLAVLSALYFSQARDVKRLREWAGRAPERAADGPPVPGRVPAPPQAQPGTAPAPAPRPGPPGVPAPAAQPGKAPVQPGTSAPAPAPAAAPTPAAPKPPAGPPVRPGAPVPAAAGAAAGTAAATAAGQNRQAASNSGAGASAVAAGPPMPAGATAAGGPATPAGGRPPGAPPVPAAPRPISQPTTIIPPQRDEPWYRRLLANPLYIVLTIAGVLVLGGAAVFAASEITGDDTTQAPERRTQAATGDEPVDDGGDQDGSRGKGRPVEPSSVTVAVLNGTTVPGLAAGVADEVKSFGFQIGTVANAPDQDSQRAESVVLFAPGHRREARAVSRRLDIPQREPVDPESQGLAGDAGVVVVAGGDRSAG